MLASTISTIINIGAKVNASLTNAFSQISGFADKIGPKFDALSKVALGSLGSLGISAGAGAAAFISYDNAVRQLQESTGVLDDSLSNVMKTVYADNFGESWEDVSQAISLINKNIGGTEEEMIAATESALAFRDTFDVDINESTRAASTMMKQFGITSEQAYNLMAQGQQQGLDYSGELIDSINEYSVQFNKLGLEASDMFNIFYDGMENGAFNLDKIGDAVKEFSIRAIDGSNTTIEGFTKLNLNADEMAKKFAAGGDTAREAFIQVTEAIGKMNNPVEQSLVGVDLFGTMWEDLGPKVVTQLGDIGDNFNEMVDTMNQINTIHYESFSASLGGIKRQVEAALIPLGESLVPVMNEFANWFASTATPKISEFANTLSSVLPGALDIVKNIFISATPLFDLALSSLPFIISMIAGLSGVIGTLKVASTLGKIVSIGSKVTGVISKIGFAFSAVSGGASTFAEGFTFITGITNPIGLVALAIGAVIAVVTLLYAKCEPFRNMINSLISSVVSWINGTLLPTIASIGEKFSGLITAISGFATWLWGYLGPIFTVIFSMAAGVVSSFVNTIGSLLISAMTVIGGIIDFVSGVFSGNWSLAWEGVKEIFRGVFDGLLEIAAAPLNAIIGLVNGAIDGINKLGFNIGKIPSISVGGGDSSSGDSSSYSSSGYTSTASLRGLPQFASGGFTNVPSICGEDGPEAVIPLRKSARSLSLLEKTSSALGANDSSNSGGNTFIFAPNISSNIDDESLKKIRDEYENFKESVLRIFEEERRESFV